MEELESNIFEKIKDLFDEHQGIKISSAIIKSKNKISIIIETSVNNIELFQKLEINIKQIIQNINHSMEAIITFTSKKKQFSPKIIIIASGKGGVGKSTFASFLALLLSKNHKVGIIDSDIYGPSIPHIFGIKDKKPRINKNNEFIPIENNGMQIVSMGSIIAEDKALIWRGPMISKTLKKFKNVQWHEDLEYIIIDSPPGTGDIHITLSETFKISGAILISTPQQMSLSETAKSLDMCKKFNIPIIGLVENMTHLNNNLSNEFCKKFNIDLIGRIPDISYIRESCDLGAPKIPEDIINIFSEISGKL